MNQIKFILSIFLILNKSILTTDAIGWVIFIPHRRPVMA